ncbi:MAG: 50S ribosomal protein L13 [Chloroflexi bacterium]|nr:50S ribosomal protein L13 [Chloroflexota bacterium]
MEKTYVPKGKLTGEWYLVDATGKTLGRLATKLAEILVGKHRPDFTPGVVLEDHVVVINAEKIVANPTRVKEKKYYRHSGHPGGLHEVDYTRQLEKNPDRIIRFAVQGMLPKNRLTARYLDNLKVYAGPEHPHQAQSPQPLDLE